MKVKVVEVDFMKKCKTLLLIFSFIIIINFFIIYNKKENYIDDNYYVQKNNPLLAMNLEQTAGAGDYKTVTQSKWPTEGYVFNSELSRCENGSTLSWDDTGSYAWATASLNTYLNSQYLNGLGTFANIISDSIWKASDVSFNSNSTLESVFNAEMADNVVIVNTKIGLAYVSDYGFAADSSIWLNNGWQSDTIGWLKNFESWTITSQGGGSLAWTASKASTFVNSFVDIDEFSTRPTFYLNSDVSYISGTGEKADPFIIN